MSKMYQQFEQHRTDNISDPSELQQRPISTISGLSGDQSSRPAHKSSVKISEVSDAEAEAITNGNSDKEKHGGDKSEKKSQEVKEKSISEEETAAEGQGDTSTDNKKEDTTDKPQGELNGKGRESNSEESKLDLAAGGEAESNG